MYVPKKSSNYGRPVLTSQRKSTTLYGKAKHAKGVMNLVKCAKCGKDIEAGKEVKKGWISKKAYHAECAPK